MCNIAFIMVLFFYQSVVCDAWTLQLDAYKEQCFFEKVEEDTTLSIHFQVTEGGFLDVDVYIKDPDGVELYAGSGESSGKFTFKSAKTGKFEICFSNLMSTLTDKKVMFDILVSPGSARDAGVHNSSDTQARWLTNVNETIEVVGEYLQGIQHEQHYILARNLITSRLSERTNRLLSWWATFHVLMSIAGVAMQIAYLKKFFEERRMV